jgi:hypothetical protein
MSLLIRLVIQYLGIIFIRRCLGYFFLLVGLCNLSPNPLSGLVWIVWALLLLPLTYQLLAKRGWRLKGRVRFGIIMASLLLIFVLPTTSERQSSQSTAQTTTSVTGSSPASSNESVEVIQPNPTPNLVISPSPVYERPTNADNGSLLPTQTGYVDGYERALMNGYSTVTVDNSKNDEDVLVKLYVLNMGPPTAARVFLIRAKEQFTVGKLNPGKYDVRYQNLDTGGRARTESFELKETNTAEGIRYSRITLTLYKVANGNMQTYPLSETEF